MVTALRKPKRGEFFTLIMQTFDMEVPDALIPQLLAGPTKIVWVNTYHLLSTKGPITLRHKCDLENYLPPPEPSTFGGQAAAEHRNSPRPPEGTSVTIWHPDGTEEIRRGHYSLSEWEDKMEQEGILEATFWLPKSIGEFLFDGVPLRWSVHKKF